MALSRLNRRMFMGSAAVLSGCVDEADIDDERPPGSGGAGGSGGEGGGAPVETCDDPFAGGQLLEELVFTYDGGQPIQVPFNTKLRQGWDARLYTDLAQIDQGQAVTPTEFYYIRTEFPDGIDTAQDPTWADTWSIDVSGLATPRSLTVADLAPLSVDQGVHVMECSGNGGGGGFGLMSAASWAGAPFEAVMDLLDVDAAATRVRIGGFDEHSTPSIGGHSTPGAAWIFTFQELVEARAFFALEMNGAPLNEDHGRPVRLYVPNWYGCTCIKWVNEIEFVDDDAPATSQMQEFASRTHQNGVPSLARDYRPASMDQAAMPVRVERWLVDGEVVHRVVGIMWGGYALAGDRLAVSFGDDVFEPVTVCPAQTTNRTWTLWEHVWRPTAPGRYVVRMAIDDPAVPTYRLDRDWYAREVNVTEV
ncbi:MAG: molybdopterin-dependent oxidoreductase [Myxococcota bacterium]